MSLLDSIAEAQLTIVDPEARLVYAWFGGQGVSVYDESGEEVDYFTIGGIGPVSPKHVRAVIEGVRTEQEE